VRSRPVGYALFCLRPTRNRTRTPTTTPARPQGGHGQGWRAVGARGGGVVVHGC